MGAFAAPWSRLPIVQANLRAPCLDRGARDSFPHAQAPLALLTKLLCKVLSPSFHTQPPRTKLRPSGMQYTVIYLSRVPRQVQVKLRAAGLSCLTIAGRTFVGLSPRLCRHLNKALSRDQVLSKAAVYFVVAKHQERGDAAHPGYKAEQGSPSFTLSARPLPPWGTCYRVRS